MTAAEGANGGARGGRFRVLVADKVSSEGLAPLRNDARFEIVEKPGLSGDDLARAIEGAHAVIVRSATKIPREALARADVLRVIGRAGVGVDTIDVDAATERGIAVLNAPAGNTVSAAELTFALLLALVRRVAAADRSMRAGEWERTRFAGSELHGKTLGLVGAGRIGGEVALRARAFGMRVMIHDPYLTEERARALGAELAPLDAVLAAADVLSVHVPLTDATEGMIGAAELARLKPTALLVNAARGGVVAEDALLEALRERRIGGAALDVYEQEPLPADHPFRALDNVVLTPHLGASTAEAQQNVAVEIAEAVRAALVEGDLSRAVNAPAVGGDEMRRLRPLLELAERLGRLAAALAHGAVERVDVRYAGGTDASLRPLAACALVGVLAHALGRDEANFVNATHLAAARGIEVRRTSLGETGDGELLELVAGWRGGEVRVTGTLLGETHTRITAIDDFAVSVAPRGTLLVLRNRDVPGVIGHVGTLLGDAGINIAEYHQARLQAGGTALAAVSIDGRLGSDVMARLRALPAVLDARQVELD